MVRYWTKNRLIFDLIIPAVTVLLVAFAFISPLLEGIGEAALMRGVYANDKLDFNVSTPSHAQIDDLESLPFIESVFPYYYKETALSVDGRSRDSIIYFTDRMEKLDQTMYCESRLIERSDKEYDNPLLIDFAFAKETGAGLGDTVTANIGGVRIDFQVAAIYEPNTYQEGGAVMAEWKGAQKEALTATTERLLYSGAYISASDRSQCEYYLRTEYKPLGRLKDRSEFDTEEAYLRHYENFMSASYSNELTDFSVKGEDALRGAKEKMASTDQYLILACVITLAIMLASNLILWFRGSERDYFASRKLLGAKSLGVYYLYASAVQAAVLVLGAIVTVLAIPAVSELYVPRDALLSRSVIFISAAVLVSALVLLENMLLVKETKR